MYVRPLASLPASATVHKRAVDHRNVQTMNIYNWNGPLGACKVTIVELMQSASSPDSSHSANEQTGDLLRVRILKGEDSGKLAMAFRGELTAEGPLPA
jgi:hypothetical protein